MRLEHRNSGTDLSLHRSNPSGLGASPGSPNGGLAAPSDSLGWLRRILLLVLLGGSIGAAIAAVAFFLQPAVYRTQARVQFVDLAQFRGLGRVQADVDYGSPLSDEVLVVRSEQVLRSAAVAGKLATTARFIGMSPSQIASGLNHDPAFVVEPAFADQATNVIRIQFDSLDPATPQQVVDAVMAAYQRHTEEKFEVKDAQVITQILEARDSALDQLQEIERQHDEFKMQTDLVFIDGRPQSVHRKTADRYQTQKQELLVTKAEIESQLNTAERSIERGDNSSTVMLALRGEGETASDVIDQNLTRQLQQLQNELRDRASVRIQEEKLLPLQLERQDLLAAYGASHPTVRSVDKQISAVERQVERMEAQEDEKEELIKQLMTTNGEPNGDDELDPEKEARRRVNLAIDALRQRLASVEQQIDTVSEAYSFEAERAKKEIAAIRESQRFDRDIARQNTLYEKLVSRLDDVQLTAGSEGLRVTPLDESQLGRRVTKPIVKWLAMGGGLGMLVGSFLAILIPPRKTDPRSEVIGASQPQQAAIGGAPLLPVDVVERSGVRHDPQSVLKLSTVDSPYSQAAEEFNSIRSALLFGEAAAGRRIIQITGATPEAGNSTVAANLAVSLARAGKRVLLVDADLRRPQIQGIFKLGDAHGLGWLLETASHDIEREELAQRSLEAIQAGPVANLSILAAGASQANPSQLLSTELVPTLLGVWRDQFDLVLVDSPPMLTVSDASTLAPRVDAVLLVVQSEEDDMPSASKSADLLASLDANVAGMIVHGADVNGAEGYRLYPANGRLRIGTESSREG
ncbi:MAG: polysaccharide biosynthesis tyrosine autokinase [Rubripirellula sp.]|nr:polysaccharide biosynthesis tyrosine autokinase [Rubripirellula sp.]